MVESTQVDFVSLLPRIHSPGVLGENMARLVSIVYKPKDQAEPGSRYLRMPLQSAELVEGHGIAGDAKGGTRGRHLNIMVAENLGELEATGFDTRPGAMGEQLIVEGISVESLPQGT